MTIDFKNAANRHYQDAEYLYSLQRWANADQLYGLSSECLLKVMIASLDSSSINLSTGDFNTKVHRKHLEYNNADKDLWNHFSLNFSGRIAAHFSLASPNPFADWDIFQRYHHERFFDKTRIDAHRNATQNLQNKVQELFINGVLT